jgi:hypothetical protein
MSGQQEKKSDQLVSNGGAASAMKLPHRGSHTTAVMVTVFATQAFSLQSLTDTGALFRRHSVSSFRDLLNAYPQTIVCIDVEDPSRRHYADDENPPKKGQCFMLFAQRAMTHTKGP